MAINTRKLGRAIGFLSLLSIPVSLIQAQTNATTAQIRPALKVLDSTKEQDGLLGSVRRVRTEIARIDIKEGRAVEAPRQLLEVTTYGVRGNRIDNVSYPVADSTAGREEYRYDDRGNIVEKILRDENGTVLSREAFAYAFDDVGNWTKMTASLVVIENGELKREPIEVTYRTLTYYAPENIPLRAAAATAENAEPAQSPPASSVRVEKPIETRNGSSPADNVRMATEIQIVLPGVVNAAEIDEQKNKSLSTSRARMVETRSVAAITPVSTTVSMPSGSVERPALKEPETQLASNGNTGPVGEVKTLTDEEKSLDMPRMWAARKKGETESDGQPNTIVERAGNSQPTTDPEPAAISPPTPSSEPTAYIEGPVKSPAPETASAASNHSSSMKAYQIYQDGRQRFEAGDIKGALDAYLESVRLEPSSPEFQLNLGHAYLTLKKDKEAIKAFKDVVKLNPELPEAHYGLGFVSFRAGKFTEAMEAFKKATTLVPDMAKAHYGLALVYLELDKMDQVVQEHRILQRLDPKLAAKLSQAFPDVDFSCRATRFCR